MKRFFILLVTLVLVVATVPSVALASETSSSTLDPNRGTRTITFDADLGSFRNFDASAHEGIGHVVGGTSINGISLVTRVFITVPAGTGFGEFLDRIPAPERSGHRFLGWGTMRGGAGSGVNAWSTASTNQTVYARWARDPNYLPPLPELVEIRTRNWAESVTDFELEVSNTRDLFARVLPIYALQDVTWISSNPNVATVSHAGTVRAVAPGTAVITAQSIVGVPTHLYTSITVTVPGAVVPQENIAPPPAGATDEIRVLVNGVPVSFDQPPIIQYGRTLVPLRAIFEALGADVEWDQATRTASAVRGNIAVSLTIDSNILNRNGEAIILDVPAQLVNDRTLVPARAIAEAFGADVDWDPATRTVIISE